MESMRKHFDINWVKRRYGSNTLVVLDSKCFLKRHLQRSVSTVGNAGFLCNMCRAMTYYVGSNWKESEPFYMNGEKWILSIYSRKNSSTRHACSRKKMMTRSVISYVCGDQHVVLQKYHPITKRLKYNRQFVVDVVNFLKGHRVNRLWCNLDVDDLSMVDGSIYLDDSNKISLTSDGERQTQYKPSRQLYSRMYSGDEPEGLINLVEMNEYVITSFGDFRIRACGDDFRVHDSSHSIDFSVIDFYSFVISLCKTTDVDEYLDRLIQLMFRRSEMGLIESIENITIKSNIFELMETNGFL